jgi:hypothetical protein
MPKMKAYATFDEFLADKPPRIAAILRALRAFVRAAAPGLEESVKWGNGCWLADGAPVAYAYADRDHVQFGFIRGASLRDPRGLLQGKGRFVRHAKVRRREDIDRAAFGALLRQAVRLGGVVRKGGASAKAADRARSTRAAKARKAPVLLSGGNPQIQKGDGDGPVRAYLDAMPGWKREAGRRLDALVVRTLPGVRKAVRWNSPFYGTAEGGWFLSFHCITRYLKVGFLNGSSLRPLPPVASKDPNTRYLHLHEGDALDEDLVTGWIRQAASLPGWGRVDA